MQYIIFSHKDDIYYPRYECQDNEVACPECFKCEIPGHYSSLNGHIYQ